MIVSVVNGWAVSRHDTPNEIGLHVVVGVQWPDREDVHPAHALKVD